MSDINKFTTKEVLNKVLLDSSGNAVNAFSHTTQEALNAALDDDNSRLNVNLVGGTIGGDVTINGDLTVNGDGAGAYDEIVNGQLVTFRDDASTVGTNDNIVIENDGAGDASLKFSLTGATDWFTYIDNSDSDKFKIRRSTTDHFTIDESGNVGIGTDSPSRKFTIVNTTTNTATGFFYTNAVHTGVDTHSVLSIRSDNASSNGDVLHVQGDGTGNLLTLSKDGSDKLTVTHEGKVGIGIVPVATLQVKTASDVNFTLSANSGDLRINAVNDAVDSAVGLEFNGADYEFLGTGTSTFGGNIEVLKGSPLIRVKDSTNSVRGFMSVSSGVVKMGGSDNNNVEIQSNGTTRLTIAGSGNSTFAGSVNIADDTTISSAEAGGLVLTIQQSNEDDNSSELKFVKDSASPATGDKLGQITFYGDDDGGTQHNFADIAVLPTGLGASSGEQGTIRFRALNGGAMKTPLTLVGENATFGGTIASSPSITDGIGLNIEADSLTTGNIGRFYSDSDSNATRNLVEITNDHIGASGTTPLRIRQDAPHTAIDIDSANTGDWAVDIQGTAHTTAGLLYAYSNSPSNSTRDLVHIHNDHPDADNTTALKIIQDGANSALTITSGNYSQLQMISSGAENGIKFVDSGGTVDGYIYATDSSVGFLNGSGSHTFKVDANSRISLSNNNRTGATNNTVFGKLAGDDLNNGGIANSFFGENAGHAVTTGDYNVAIGLNSLDGSTNAQRVTAIGTATMRANTTADAEGAVAVGYGALNALTSGGRNLAIGYQSLDALTEADDNIAIGYQALTASSETQAHRNIAIGGYALSTLNARGQENIAIGFEALQTANDADIDANIAIGNYVLDDVGGAGVWACVGIGHNALTAVNNAGAVGSTAIGYYSLSALTSGQKNTAVGFESLKSNTIGDKNTAVGYQALESFNADTDAHGHNTAVGHNAMQGNATGTDNTAIGHQSAFSGTNNMTSGDNNTFIGSLSTPSSATPTNQTVIGYNAVGQADNSVTLGDSNVTDVYMAQDSGAKVHAGEASFTGDVTVSSDIIHAGDTDNKIKFEANKVTLSNTVGTIVSTPTSGGISSLYVTAIHPGNTDVYKIGGMQAQIPTSAWLSANVKLLGPALTGYGTGIEYLKFETDGTNKFSTFSSVVNANSGINFPDSQVASSDANTLDDYEEGDWTPVITFGGNSNNIAYGTQAGKYTKVGRVIHCTCEIILTNKGDSTGQAKIGGLPFTISNTDGAEGAVSLLVGNITFADYPQGYLAKNTQTIELSEVTNAGGVTDLSNADFANNSYIRVAFSFIN